MPDGERTDAKNVMPSSDHHGDGEGCCCCLHFLSWSWQKSQGPDLNLVLDWAQWGQMEEESKGGERKGCWIWWICLGIKDTVHLFCKPTWILCVWAIERERDSVFSNKPTSGIRVRMWGEINSHPAQQVLLCKVVLAVLCLCICINLAVAGYGLLF